MMISVNGDKRMHFHGVSLNCMFQRQQEGQERRDRRIRAGLQVVEKRGTSEVETWQSVAGDFAEGIRMIAR